MKSVVLWLVGLSFVVACGSSSVGASPSTDYAELQSKTSPFPAGSGVSYGLGVTLTDASISPAGAGMGHGGDIDGYHGLAIYFPAKKTAIATIVDQNGKNPNDIFVAALTTLFP